MVERVTVNGDLRKERTTCTFDVEELTYILDGGAEITDKKRKFGTVLCLCTLIRLNASRGSDAKFIE